MVILIGLVDKMPYACMDCGECRTFKRSRRYTHISYGTVYITMDEDDQETDREYGDLDDGEDEDNDEEGVITCGDCDSDNISDLSIDEWERIAEENGILQRSGNTTMREEPNEIKNTMIYPRMIKYDSEIRKNINREAIKKIYPLIGGE